MASCKLRGRMAAPEGSAPKDDLVSTIRSVCRDLLAPIVNADGGEVYLVSATTDAVHLHLSGTCAGCPGASLTRDKVLAPILTATAPKARLTVTTGWKIPEGATKLGA